MLMGVHMGMGGSWGATQEAWPAGAASVRVLVNECAPPHMLCVSGQFPVAHRTGSRPPEPPGRAPSPGPQPARRTPPKNRGDQSVRNWLFMSPAPQLFVLVCPSQDQRCSTGVAQRLEAARSVAVPPVRPSLSSK